MNEDPIVHTQTEYRQEIEVIKSLPLMHTTGCDVVNYVEEVLDFGACFSAW